MLDVYATFAEEWMAMPVIRGAKTEAERFAGAVDTYCIEAIMQDGKSLQAGTSHFLGQNFAKAFDCTFQNRNNELEYVWATSWGVSTRLIGALVMTHGDDKGIVLPPKLAPTQVVLVPILRKEGSEAVLEAARKIEQVLADAGIRVFLDDRDQYRPGWKFTEYEVQGVPIRLALGPRDIENGVVELVRRDSGEKQSVPLDGLAETIRETLDAVQQGLFSRAKAFREAHTNTADDYETFQRLIEEEGGFVLMHWDGTAKTEARIKEETKATIRCLPFPGQFEGTEEPGVDPVSGQPSKGRVVFARAY